MITAPVSGAINLANQVALVTGGAGGIGAAIIDAFVREGAAVAIVAHRLSTGEALAADVASRGGSVIALEADVASRAEVDAAVAETVRRLGRLDIAVSAAGVMSTNPLREIDETEWETVVAVNMKGAFNVLRAVFPVMEAAQYGKIVCIGSIAGEQGGLVSGPHYAAAKAGVHAMAKSAAKAGAPHGIYVNAVSPGPVLTPMWISANNGVPRDDPDIAPLGRVGRAEDVAEAVLFLASQMSNWVTGVVLDVNGGILMR